MKAAAALLLLLLLLPVAHHHCGSTAADAVSEDSELVHDELSEKQSTVSASSLSSSSISATTAKLGVKQKEDLTCGRGAACAALAPASRKQDLVEEVFFVGSAPAKLEHWSEHMLSA